MAQTIIETPIGPLFLQTTERGIRHLDFVDDPMLRSLASESSAGTPHRLASHTGPAALREFASEVKKQRPERLVTDHASVSLPRLASEAEKQRPERLVTNPASVGLSVRTPDLEEVAAEVEKQLEEYFAGRRKRFDLPLDLVGTEFQRRVWQAIAAIPFGETASYAQVAASAGAPNAYRAAGTACGANPVVLVVPCHRVIGSDRSLHGFGGGLETKVWLLRHESLACQQGLPPDIRGLKTLG